jgi:N4-gp56 family major capsid protein
VSINNFIGTVWSSRLLQALEKSLVYGQAGVVNRDYEGDIQNVGDTVKINSIGDPTIVDYTKNTDMSGPETLTDATRTLVINQAKAFNFQVDDVDKAQGAGRAGVLDEAMRRAAYKLSDVADQYLAGIMVAGATTNTIGSTGSPVAVDKTNAYETLLRASVKLDSQNAPSAGRWAIVPPWYGAILASDTRFIGDTPSGPVLTNGRVGEAAGFTLLSSNNVPVGSSKFSIVAGVSGATSYAEQVNSVEAYRPQARFADAVKGLHLYGGKVVRPEELVLITATDNSGLSA